MPLPNSQAATLLAYIDRISATLATYVNPYYIPDVLTEVKWDFPNIIHTGIDIDYKLTVKDWFNRAKTFRIISGPAGSSIDADGFLHFVADTDNVDHEFTIGVAFDGANEITKTFTSRVRNADCGFIATDGNDVTGDGTLANPFATLDGAVGLFDGDTLGKTIFFRGGSYTFNNRLLFGGVYGSVQSRIKADPLLFRSYPGELADFNFPSSGGFTNYDYGFGFYNLKVSGAVCVDADAPMVIYDGCFGKLIEVTGTTGNNSQNVAGIYHVGGSYLDWCYSHDNKATSFDGPDHNESDYIFYGTKGSEDAEVFDSIATGGTNAGFKIKHAGDHACHYQNIVATSGYQPTAIAANRASVRHSMLWADLSEFNNSAPVGVNVTDITTDGEVNTDEAMLWDSNIAVLKTTGTGSTLVQQRRYYFVGDLAIVTEGDTIAVFDSQSFFAGTSGTLPVLYINNKFETHNSDAGAFFVAARYSTDTLPAEFRPLFIGNEIYCANESNAVILENTTISLDDLLALYGDSNTKVAARTHTKTVAGRTFQIIAGEFSEVVI